MVKLNRLLTALACVLVCASTPAFAGNSSPHGWIATWATASSVQSPFDAPTPAFNDVTLRQIVRISIGGDYFRVWLTNEHGTQPLRIGSATIAARDVHSAILAGTLQPLTFNGASTATIPAGARILSDPVRMQASNHADLAISIHLPDDLSAQTSPASYHVRALQTSYIAPGDQTAEADLSNADTTTAWFYLAGVETRSGWRTAVIALLGDSITDGDQLATMPPVDLNARYANFLARRLGHNIGLTRFDRAAVVNLGISGNQVLSTFIGTSMLARLSRDVLTQTGVTHVIVLGGINDLGLPVLLGAPAGATAEALIAGHKQIAEQARARGLKVIGATITPAGGTFLPGYNSAETDEIRRTVNDWIRNSGTYDAVVDFARVLQEPSDPSMMRVDVTADGLHPNTEGYRRMAAAAAAVIKHLEG